MTKSTPTAAALQLNIEEAQQLMTTLILVLMAIHLSTSNASFIVSSLLKTLSLFHCDNSSNPKIVVNFSISCESIHVPPLLNGYPPLIVSMFQ